MRKKLFELIKKKPIYVKLLKFFHENPNCLDTAENLSRWISEEKEKVIKALHYLASLGFLIKHKTDVTEGFGYTQDEELIAQVGRFLNDIEEIKDKAD